VRPLSDKHAMIPATSATQVCDLISVISAWRYLAGTFY